MPLTRSACTVALASLMLGACAEAPVVRLVDGRPVAGRFISPSAYFLFAEAAMEEERGQLRKALSDFELAASSDDASPEIWSRIGALRCRLGSVSVADEAFAKAEAVDPRFGPTYRERANCELTRGRHEAALVAARRAVELAPEDVQSSILEARALEGLQRFEDARWVLRALVVHYPTRLAPWVELRELARRVGDKALEHETDERIASLSDQDPTNSKTEARATTLARIDEALAAHDVDRVLRLGTAARVDSGELALRAAALGHMTFAEQQARLVLGADPANTDARIALAWVFDVKKDHDGIASAMRGIPQGKLPPSPLGRLLLAELLARRVGVAAAKAWIDAGGGFPAPDQQDPVEADADRRVRALLR